MNALFDEPDPGEPGPAHKHFFLLVVNKLLWCPSILYIEVSDRTDHLAVDGDLFLPTAHSLGGLPQMKLSNSLFLFFALSTVPAAAVHAQTVNTGQQPTAVMK